MIQLRITKMEEIIKKKITVVQVAKELAVTRKTVHQWLAKTSVEIRSKISCSCFTSTKKSACTSTAKVLYGFNEMFFWISIIEKVTN